jgi:membrane-bound lytic murein transglycosylase D
MKDMLALADDCRRDAECDHERFLARFDEVLGARTRMAGEGDGPENGGEPATAVEAAAEVSSVITTFPSAQDAVNQLGGRNLRDVIVTNEAVKAAMAEWLTSLRPQLINGYEQYQYLRFLMWPEFERAGLPEALLFAIIARESGGRVHALSPAGAAGPMQFMPATGRRFGLGWVDGFDTRYDPQLAARASQQYLDERFAELGHNLELALAAYNGGEGRVGRLARQHPGKSFWDSVIYNALPQETRDYVPYLLAAAWLFLHPEEYGLEFPRVNGAATILKLEQPASINQLTICLGNGGSRYGYFRALRNLNPRPQPEAALPAGTELRVPVDVVPLYRNHCLTGPRATEALALVQARKPARSPTAVAQAGGHAHRYTVRPGDTLSGIARRHGCSSGELARANRLRAPYALRPGQRLSLSGCRG